MIEKDNDGNWVVYCSVCENTRKTVYKNLIESHVVRGMLNGVVDNKPCRLAFTCNSCMGKAKAPEPKFKVGDRVRDITTGGVPLATVVGVNKNKIKVDWDTSMSFSWWWPESDFELVKEDKTMGKKKMYRVIGPSGTIFTESETVIGALLHHTDLVNASQRRPRDTTLSGDLPCERANKKWIELEKEGWRVEEFYVDDEPEIDWPAEIEKCMEQDKWGNPKNCALCRAVGIDRESAYVCQELCGECPLWRYEGVSCCRSYINKMEELGLDCGMWDRKVMIPLLADVLKVERAKKETGKK